MGKKISALEDIKQRVMGWSRGLPLEGSTKEELKASLTSMHWTLECELHSQKESLINEIEKLDIPEE